MTQRSGDTADQAATALRRGELILLPTETVYGLGADAGNAEAVAAIFQIVDGAQVMGAAMMRGLHDTRVPMLFDLFGYWVIGIGVGAVLAFPMGLEGLGVWIGLATGLAVVSVLMLWRWSRREKLGLVALGAE